MARFFIRQIGKRQHLNFILSILILIIALGTTERVEGKRNAMDYSARQNVTADDIFDQALAYYNDDSFLYAAMYFKSYTLLNSDYYQTNATHRAQVNNALRFSINKVNQWRDGLDSCQVELNRMRAQDGLGKISSGLGSSPPRVEPLASTPVSYSLVCRGGGGYSGFYYLNSSTISRNPQIWINYHKGARGVGQNSESRFELSPGQCSWKDRKISTNEPEWISILSDTLNLNNFRIGWRDNEVIWGGTEQYKFLETLAKNDQGFVTFRVYNDGANHFIVTKILDN